MVKPSTPSEQIRSINQRLRAARVPLSALLRGSSLYLRTTRVPPKPGDSPGHRYELPMGPASASNLARLETEAHSIWQAVIERRFDWGQYGGREPRGEGKEPGTVGQYVEAFEAHYVGCGQCSQTTFTRFWRGEVLGRLPQDSHPTPSLLLAAVLKTPANSRLRKRTCQKLQKFADFAGLDVDLRQYQGNYGFKSVAPRDLPTDEQIEAWYQAIPNPCWRIIFARIAAFGLRPSESFFFEHLDTHTARVLDAKAGASRITKAFHPRWAEDWAMTGDLPRITWNNPRQSAADQIRDRIGHRLRGYGVTCERYDLRHAWCVRASVEYKIPTPVVAKWAGHSEDVHLKIYNRWIRLDQQEQVYREVLRSQSKP